MPTLATLLLFSVVALGFAALPGPSNLFVLTRGLGLGPRPAVAGAAGCATGASVYVVMTAVGLSALLASSQTIFAVLHYLGAAYLVLLGVRAWRSPPEVAVEEEGAARPAGAEARLWRSYRQGVVVELSNPKVALFFLALFPQFVHPDRGPAALQILVLGALFVVLGFLSDATYALGSGVLGRWLRRRPALLRRQPQLSGALYVGLGAWVAASGADASAAPRPR
ncbi:LysE family translocator [Conexibacter sp. JD483]|uniref:LysE family translocator n=1 Tax=unclassified Conexibacter TaxID=2627773 RepID=UPI002724ECED|nr:MULTISPECIES: LysE family translocator [unclassified Conexibacter]MDO8187992.1 LysE family translocator [Conexibacter sp. CPCC 205706]MDO8200875.1 LysE family translocator [Conexibacter sp. CPCC 205762]MDR9370392.1 LysE family translocator [Conexibacter sp. JD483]